MNIFLILLSLVLWGIVHSFLASYFAKDMINSPRFYRLGYNLFAGVSFLPVVYLVSTLPNESLYQVPAPWSYVMLGVQALSVLMVLAALLQTDTLSFIGIRQLFEVEKPGQLMTRGLYKLVRHPLYTFSLFFIWFSPNMSQNSFVFYIGITLYVFIGAYFEERKLLRDFGEIYAEYKRKTAFLLPGLF